MEATLSIKGMLNSASEEQRADYRMACRAAYTMTTTLDKLSDENPRAAIIACRLMGSLGLLMEIPSKATPAERDEVFDNSFDFMRLHLSDWISDPDFKEMLK